MIPVAAPPRVRQRLSAADGLVRVLHAGPEAWYVEVDGWAVGVLSRDAAQVPCGLRSQLTGSALAVPGEPAWVEGGTLWLGGRAFRPTRAVGVGVPRVNLSRGFRSTVTAPPPRPVADFAQAILGSAGEPLDDQRMAGLAPGLVGAGEGLTPLGDDLLCGWLATHRAAGRPTPATDAALDDLLAPGRRPATTVLSATLLDCARRGEALPELGSWLRALGSSEEGAHLARLQGIGSTSGAGLAEGGRLALLSLSSLAQVVS